MGVGWGEFISFKHRLNWSKSNDNTAEERYDIAEERSNKVTIYTAKRINVKYDTEKHYFNV